MRDGAVSAAIAVGDPEGLAEAYDRWAPALYAYCLSLLRETADAAEAVQDTFVIAASELAGLRDRNRLRSWLYAVARNECLRRIGAGAARAADPADVGPEGYAAGEAGREELGALLRSAVYHLNGGEQDLIRLRWQQGLDVAEIAAILGLTRDHVHALLSRARDQLQAALATLLVARAGGDDCDGLGTLLEGDDGQPAFVTREELNRHIRRCRVCARRRRREQARARRLGLAPLAELPVAAKPARMRARVLRLANSNTPGAVAYRASVRQRAAPFGSDGFPKPIDPPRPRWRPTRQRQAAVAAGVAVTGAVAAAALLTLALASGGSGHSDVAGGGRAVSSAGTGLSTVVGVGLGSPGVPGFTRPSGSANASPTATASHPRPTAGGPAGGSAPGSWPSAPAPTSARPESGPGSPAAPARSATATPAATRRPTATATPRPVRGTLTVAPATITIPPFPGSSVDVTLTASKAPVSWSITLSTSLIGALTVAPSSGTLAAGAKVTVVVTAGDLLAGSGQLTVNPGGITVTVALGSYYGAVPGIRGASSVGGEKSAGKSVGGSGLPDSCRRE